MNVGEECVYEEERGGCIRDSSSLRQRGEAHVKEKGSIGLEIERGEESLSE